MEMMLCTQWIATITTEVKLQTILKKTVTIVNPDGTGIFSTIQLIRTLKQIINGYTLIFAEFTGKHSYLNSASQKLCENSSMIAVIFCVKAYRVRCQSAKTSDSAEFRIFQNP